MTLAEQEARVFFRFDAEIGLFAVIECECGRTVRVKEGGATCPDCAALWEIVDDDEAFDVRRVRNGDDSDRLLRAARNRA